MTQMTFYNNIMKLSTKTFHVQKKQGNQLKNSVLKIIIFEQSRKLPAQNPNYSIKMPYIRKYTHTCMPSTHTHDYFVYNYYEIRSRIVIVTQMHKYAAILKWAAHGRNYDSRTSQTV